MKTNRIPLVLGSLAAVLAVVAIAAAAWWATPRHPAGIVGTWDAGPGVTVTFAENGQVTPNGEGGAPPILADLANFGHWEVARGKIFLRAKLPDGSAPSSQNDYSIEQGGTLLRIGNYHVSSYP